MDRKLFDDGLELILVAFPGMEMTKERAGVWYDTVKNDMSDKDWGRRVVNCIKNCHKNIPVLADIVDSKGLNCDDYFRA